MNAKELLQASGIIKRTEGVSFLVATDVRQMAQLALEAPEAAREGGEE